ncbi:MAG: hypothetical protein JNG84_00575 [Archangium sp.]|nr:hypothetical protein [Archangium sp.]
MRAELLEDKAVVLQLYGVLSEIDPVRWRDDAAPKHSAALDQVRLRMTGRHRLAPLAGTLDETRPSLQSDSTELKSQWLAFKQRMQPAYEAMAASLRAHRVHVPSLRPTNWARSFFHVFSAALAVAIIELSPSSEILIGLAGLYAVAGWSMELTRRWRPSINTALMKLFGPVAHAHETYRINSATWYATALLVLTLTRNPLLCAAGVAILGVADPIAAFIGRRYGRNKLINGRSLEGSLAFVASGALVAWAVISGFHPELGASRGLVVAAAAALAGAIAELVSVRVDDNFSIPVASAAGAWLALTLI